MKLLLGLSSALVLVLVLMAGRGSAQKPHRCRAPPLLSGSMSVSAQDGQDWAFAKYLYDAFDQRIRLREFGQAQNKSFHVDMLFLFQEGVSYSIDYKNQTCQKIPLSASFHPLEIPHNASLLSQVVLGGSSGPGEGLLVNTWTGDVPGTEDKYLATVTEYGCMPVSTLYHTARTGWIVTTFFNAVKGIEDPKQLIPPPFCVDAKTEDKKLDFFSAFL